MIDTKEQIRSLFDEIEVQAYKNLSQQLQEKYRLYITRRIYVNTFYSDDTLSPTKWLEQYEEKKKIEEISIKLGMTKQEVIDTYNSAIEKVRKYLIEKGIDKGDL